MNNENVMDIEDKKTEHAYKKQGEAVMIGIALLQ